MGFVREKTHFIYEFMLKLGSKIANVPSKSNEGEKIDIEFRLEAGNVSWRLNFDDEGRPFNVNPFKAVTFMTEKPKILNSFIAYYR